MIDFEIGRAISEVAPDLGARAQAAEVSAFAMENAERFLAIGERPDEWDVTLSDVLE
jgi:hypothetical protein